MTVKFLCGWNPNFDPYTYTGSALSAAVQPAQQFIAFEVCCITILIPSPVNLWGIVSDPQARPTPPRMTHYINIHYNKNVFGLCFNFSCYLFFISYNTSQLHPSILHFSSLSTTSPLPELYCSSLSLKKRAGLPGLSTKQSITSYNKTRHKSL